MTEKLLPCPFCGSADITEHVHPCDANDSFASCESCLATAVAVDLWNQRAPQQSAAVPLSVPDGWKLAPKAATYEMHGAGAEAGYRYLRRTGGNNPSAIYDAMLAAAPEPPAIGIADIGMPISNWISVDERLPEKYGIYLAYTNDWSRTGIAYYDGENWEDAEKYNVDEEPVVTHWMPLPPPPEVQS